MIDAAKQDQDKCFQQIDNIQHAVDNPVENDDDNTTYKRKQQHLCHLQTQEWDRIQDINIKISHLEENADHRTDPEIHHNLPPQSPKTHIRLQEDRDQNDDDHWYADTKPVLYNTITHSQNPDFLTLVILHHIYTPDMPKTYKIRNNHDYKSTTIKV